ncbi:MAG TPA: hypothetical protein QF355_07420 [Candidatus Marinimicrobia bacterium]|jgi:hypothetical protein|nr:hypothetical protein [Candidatus Neomarinimicrobiota bacterium]MDP6260427.1 hypothetical protein [Candidatus Neomarinimicrobiota bacterium]MDP7126314.1 hypothetical protein [Candidatus Neomarinimicrobiota bacterium]MDP7337432.1 hypothetical protein [Candidatus Neomarinimicrobiota bacterium]MDP7475854.1 hypothetical protein [Candidatus Neomarinimicrobiota bacterium]|tara:strand:- start:6047 stop:6439 length:393 start_codon:yes stop_codon:yes gene_type:complete
MNIRSDMNARTAMVYGGAAFLLVIIGFRSIFATLDPDHIGVMTYLSIGGLVLEFFLLILYAHSIYNLGPDGGGESNASVGNMDGKEISELTAAVIKVAQMGEGLSNLASGKVRDEVRKEVNEILSKAIKK